METDRPLVIPYGKEPRAHTNAAGLRCAQLSTEVGNRETQRSNYILLGIEVHAQAEIVSSEPLRDVPAMPRNLLHTRGTPEPKHDLSFPVPFGEQAKHLELLMVSS
jgi:hypothetical protein